MVTGKRRFSTSFNLRARGNVKSTEMSGIALYGMCADAIYPPLKPAKFEQMPEVECVSSLTAIRQSVSGAMLD